LSAAAADPYDCDGVVVGRVVVNEEVQEQAFGISLKSTRPSLLYLIVPDS
jgi:hypothetical protein